MNLYFFVFIVFILVQVGQMTKQQSKDTEKCFKANHLKARTLYNQDT